MYYCSNSQRPTLQKLTRWPRSFYSTLNISYHSEKNISALNKAAISFNLFYIFSCYCYYRTRQLLRIRPKPYSLPLAIRPKAFSQSVFRVDLFVTSVIIFFAKAGQGVIMSLKRPFTKNPRSKIYDTFYDSYHLHLHHCFACSENFGTAF